MGNQSQNELHPSGSLGIVGRLTYLCQNSRCGKEVGQVYFLEDKWVCKDCYFRKLYETKNN